MPFIWICSSICFLIMAFYIYRMLKYGIDGDVLVGKNLVIKKGNLTPQEKAQLTIIDKAIIRNIATVGLSAQIVSDDMKMTRAELVQSVWCLAGMRTLDYIQEIRMRRASELLLEQGYTGDQVISMVGLNDTKHFKKCFKRTFGIQPDKYRIIMEEKMR